MKCFVALLITLGCISIIEASGKQSFEILRNSKILHFLTSCIHTCIQVFHFISGSCNRYWSNEYGQGCADYINRNWCTPDGDYGTAWDMAWGTFDENAVDGIVENGQNALVCPQCGCKEGNLTILPLF